MDKLWIVCPDISISRYLFYKHTEKAEYTKIRLTAGLILGDQKDYIESGRQLMLYHMSTYLQNARLWVGSLTLHLPHA